jgi:hypothetical protein
MVTGPDSSCQTGRASMNMLSTQDNGVENYYLVMLQITNC